MIKHCSVFRTVSLLLPLLLWTSCADTYQFILPEDQPDPEVPVEAPSYDEVLQKWEAALPSAEFFEPVEVVPTNPEDPDFDNFLENQDFKPSRTVTLTWMGSTVSIDNPQAEKGVDIEVNGSRVIVRNLESEAGADDARGKVTYCLRGHTPDGQLKVYSNKKFQLLLEGVDLCCSDGPAISIQHKKRCFVTLAEGTSNSLSDSEVYASDDVQTAVEDEKGCLFSEGQLIFSGKGQLSVVGHHQHGIASDEYVRVHPGCQLTVQAVKDGIHTKQQYHQSGGLVRSYALKDGLQTDSLGVTFTGGFLYLFGERPLTTNGEGKLQMTSQARLCLLPWVY